MAKRYYKRSYRRSGKGGNPIGLLILLALFLFFKYWKLLLLAAIVISVILYLRRRKADKAPQIAEAENAPVLTDPVQQTYSAKDSIMTDCERDYFEAIRKTVEPAYTVQPQVNLASVVNKESQSRYRNELFRNIDFGVFDRDYKLRVLIEINDQTHTAPDRRERDQKVKAICEEAGIPLVTFWTKYGVNEGYIRERLAQHLTLAPADHAEPAAAQIPEEVQ